MNISSLSVGPFTYSVQVSDGFDTDHNGETDNDGLRIRIRASVPEQHQDEILLHELLHALWATLDLPRKDEESIITKLSPLLLDTIRRNPGFATLLAGEP